MFHYNLNLQNYHNKQQTNKICTLIIFYINGTPFKEFGGNYTEDNLRQFVKEVSIKAYEIIGTPQQEEGSISQHSVWKGGVKKSLLFKF